MRVWREDQRNLNFRAGLIASAVYNVAPGKRRKPINPMDFFEARSATDAMQSPEELLHGFQQFQSDLRMAGGIKQVRAAAKAKR